LTPASATAPAASRRGKGLLSGAHHSDIDGPSEMNNAAFRCKFYAFTLYQGLARPAAKRWLHCSAVSHHD
jgi:hypothetical protein